VALGVLFSQPYYEATVSSSADALTYLWPCVIDGRPYQLDLASGQYVQRSLDVNRSQPRNANRSEEALEPSEEVWRSLVGSWHHGAGQRVADRSTSDEFRFYDSRGVDPWTEWQVGLLNSVENLLWWGYAPSENLRCVVAGGYLAVITGEWLIWHNADFTVAGEGSAFGDNLLGITTDGVYVWTYDEAGVVRRHQPGTTVTLATIPGASGIGYAKGRLVVGAGPKVYDVVGTTATEILDTEGGLTFTQVADGPGGVMLAAVAGDRSFLYRAQIREDGTGLQTPAQVGVLPDGETLLGLGYYLGFVLCGTARGVRVGVDSGEDITLGPLLETGPCRAFEGQSKYVWFGWENMAEDSNGTGRLDLTTFTSPLAPAYAADISWDEDPTSTPSTKGHVQSIVTFGNRRVFALAGQGIVAEDLETKVASAWLEQGWFGFGVADEKIGLYAQLRHRALHGGLELELAFDDGGYVTIGSSRTGGTVSSPNLAIPPRNAYQFGLRYVLHRASLVTGSDDPPGPLMTRMELRATPVVGDATEWTVPVAIREMVTVDGSTVLRDTLEDESHLIGLATSGKTFVYREGSRSWPVNCVGYTWVKERRAADMDGWQGTLVLKLRSVQ
jgi:hypothetical protein